MARRDISFASFNLLNLQLPGRPVYRNATGWSEATFERKVDFTARVLARLGADCFGVQELWAPEALQMAVDRAGLSASHRVIAPPDHGGDRIVCAAVVRADMIAGEAEWITAFPPELVLRSSGDDAQQGDISVTLASFSRPVLHLRLRPDPRTPIIDLFVCHLKSRRPAEIWRERGWYDPALHKPHAAAIGYALSTIRRTAEAAALRVMITRLTGGSPTPVVVIGDMNDGKDSNTLNVLTGQPRYLTTLSVGGGDGALYTAQTLQEYRTVRDVYYTHIHQDQHDSLDHILISEEFYDNSRDRLWRFDEMVVLNDHLSFDDHATSGTSDHGIVMARFIWKPAPALAPEDALVG